MIETVNNACREQERTSSPDVVQPFFVVMKHALLEDKHIRQGYAAAFTTIDDFDAIERGGVAL